MRTDLSNVLTPGQQGITKKTPQLERIEEDESEKTQEQVARQEQYKLDKSISDSIKYEEIQHKYDKIARTPTKPNKDPAKIESDNFHKSAKKLYKSDEVRTSHQKKKYTNTLESGGSCERIIEKHSHIDDENGS